MDLDFYRPAILHPQPAVRGRRGRGNMVCEDAADEMARILAGFENGQAFAVPGTADYLDIYRIHYPRIDIRHRNQHVEKNGTARRNLVGSLDDGGNQLGIGIASLLCNLGRCDRRGIAAWCAIGYAGTRSRGRPVNGDNRFRSVHIDRYRIGCCFVGIAAKHPFCMGNIVDRLCVNGFSGHDDRQQRCKERCCQKPEGKAETH